MKQKIKSILKYPFIFIIVIIIFILTLLLSSLFPRDWIQENTYESAEILEEEGNPFEIIGIRLDNYTDALMINTAYSINPSEPFESIMLDRKNYLPDKNQIIYSDKNLELACSKEADNDIMKELMKTVNNDIGESFEYARYWHGYLVFLRPALIFFNISEIKVINCILLALLAFYLIMNLSKRINSRSCWVIILGLVIFDYFLMGLTFQGLMTFFISMIFSIIICKRFEKIKNIGIYFFVAGMITCFLDLLTHPIITLGLPMIIYFLLKQEKEKVTLKEAIKIIVINSILWGIGYLLTYITKWVLVDAIYNRNLVTKAITQFFYRSQEDIISTMTWSRALQKNFDNLGIKNLIYFIPLIIYIIIELVRNYKTIRFDIKAALPYLIISIMPIAWIILMKNHSIYHDYFTYRGLIIFYIGIGIFCIKLLNIKQKDEVTNTII